MPKLEISEEDLEMVRELTIRGMTPEKFRQAQRSLLPHVLGKKLLEEVFTPERTANLGYADEMRVRFLKNMEGGMSACQILTIKELAGYRKTELLRRPGFAKKKLQYAEAVLKTIGIEMRN